MGSSGSGRISDYPGSSTTGQAGGSGGSGGSDEDRCSRAFRADLEDVEQSEYFGAHGSTPDVGTELHIGLEKRLVARTINGESVGNLPTSLNYLASCLKEGWTYVGSVQSANDGPPEATIGADFAAIAPE